MTKKRAAKAANAQCRVCGQQPTDHAVERFRITVPGVSDTF